MSGRYCGRKYFEHERSVILTGATLGYDGKADRFREMVGMDGGKDLFMGSPFDYKRAALVAVPEDMPEPGRQGYATTVADAVEDIATKLRDRVLVLFTSNSALESARRSLSSRLEAAGIRLIAQGADGPPHRVMRELARNRKAVALGTSSLWEGVDLEGASIKALVMTRLPFPRSDGPCGRGALRALRGRLRRVHGAGSGSAFPTGVRQADSLRYRPRGIRHSGPAHHLPRLWDQVSEGVAAVHCAADIPVETWGDRRRVE